MAKPKRKKPIPVIKRRRPTMKQKVLVKKIIENYGKKKPAKSMGKIMKDAGYTDASAVNPGKIINTPSFMALLDKYGMSDDNLAKVGAAGLMINPGKNNSTGKWMIKHKFFESGLKLRKHMNPMGEEVVDAFKQMFQIMRPPKVPLPTK